MMMRVFSFFSLSARRLVQMCNKKKGYKGHDGHQIGTNWSQTTTTTTAMMTTTTTNTAQQKRTPEQEERLRYRWENRVVGALFRKLKREVRAANALFWTLEWVCPDLVAMWFMPGEEADVTSHAALAEECLDNARAHAKRKGRALPPCSVYRWLHTFHGMYRHH
jgi:hypothetical protein